MAWCVCLAAALGAAGCGGRAEEAAPPGEVPGTAAAAPQATGLDSLPVVPLLADDGSVRPSAPQAVPADPLARTRAGRYASSASAEQLGHQRAEGWLAVSVPGSGAAAVAAALAGALGQAKAMGLSPDAPVLVAGADLRTAAAVADALEAAGLARVWLVTP